MTFSLFREILFEELEERNWGICELAHYSGLTQYKTFNIANGHEMLTKETAKKIGKAFETSGEVWIGLYESEPIAMENQ